MTDKRHWDDVMRLFREALSRSIDQRPAFLDKDCAGDTVRADVQSLLDSHQNQPTSFLESPGGENGDTPDTAEVFGASASDPMIGRVVGNCTIKSRLAGGNMGRVYVALHHDLGIKVAVKILPAEAATESAMKRFDMEIQTLAKLRHPAIAQLYHPGHYEPEGANLPFFVMEYVANASTITKYVRSRKLNLRERVQLFAQVCDAVYVGHQKGIVHRDLKPGNVLVDGSGNPKVIDFGIAKVTDSNKAALTGEAQVIGTLQYMSPEQFDKDSDDLDARSDVYALGLLLYELLCERQPYNVDTQHAVEAARVVREELPPQPSSVNRVLRGDIKTITLKAMEKDRTRRYRDAASMADDIRNFLNDDPITARPPSLRYQLGKIARKRKGAFGAAAVVAISLVGGLGTAVYALAEMDDALAVANDAVAERDDALAEKDDALAEKASALETLKSKQAIIEDLEREAEEEQLYESEESLRGKLADGATPSDTEAEIQIQLALASAFESIEHFARARPHLQNAYDLAAEHMGSSSREAIRALTRLGICHSEMEEKDLAIEILEDAHRRALASLDESDDVAMSAMASLGLAYSRSGAFDEALPLLRQAAQLRETHLGPRDPKTSRVRQNLGALLAKMDQLDAAVAEYERVLDAYLQEYGEEHWETFLVMSNMAIAYERIGQREQIAGDDAAAARAYETGLNLYTQLAPTARTVLPADSPKLHSILNGYGSALRVNGRYDEAEDVLLEVFQFYERRDGLATRRAQTAIRQLKALYRATENRDQADYFDSLIIQKPKKG